MKGLIVCPFLLVLAFAHYDVGIFDVTRQVQRQNCCDICLCQNSSVYCNSRELYFTPVNVSRNAEFLELEGNHITVLPRDSLSNLTGLFRLSLRGNELKAIHRRAFSRLDALTSLDLSQNQLDSIRLDLPEKLEFLDLSWNKLDWIIDPSVLNASNLKLLNLSHNLIKAPRFQLDPVFTNFSELKILDVSGNVLMSLVEDSLEFLPGSVEVLNLAHCDMIDADPNSLVAAADHLKTLDLSGNYLTLNELKALFIAMPDNSLETIKLSEMKIQEVVPDPFFPGWKNLREVDFSRNRIEMVSDIAFQGTQIETLHLSDNLLKPAFLNLSAKNLPKLKTLNLDGNDLDWIPNMDITTMTHIDLSRNELRVLDTSPLTMTNLTRFVARENMISDFDLSIFDYYVHFEYLDLSYNLLTSFDLSPAVARRLHILKISHNNITEITTDTSKRLFHIDTLDLGYNKLTMLPPHLFERMPKLRHLNLAGNPNLIRKGVAFSSQMLSYFDLSDNNLITLEGVTSKAVCVDSLVLNNNDFTQITERDFRVVNKHCLTSISIKDNLISSVNITVFQAFPSLITLDMSRNPYWCGCGLESFIEWIRSTKIKLKDYSHGYVCQTPLQLEGVELWTVRKSLLDDCTPLSWFTSTGIYLTVAFTLLLFLALLLSLVISRDTTSFCRRKFLPDKIYVSCTEKVKNLRRSSKDYPQLFNPGLSRSPSTSGYHHLETDTSQC